MSFVFVFGFRASEFGVMSLGVWGLGLQVGGLESRVWSLGFQVGGLGFEV
jgi:hypothetical protein